MTEGAGAPTPSAWRLPHSGGLDGLRAIAVMLVIGVHSWFSGFPGGGIGVTMFFTLSGFLITALLLGELGDDGRLSFKNFYMRRVLRLFPALVVFVLIVFLYSKITGFDEKRVGPAVPAALLYYANWARAAGANLGMLGHTWSLAVEEQFYLIWPAILWIAYRVRGLWGVLVAALVGTAASTVVRIILQSDPSPAMSARIQNGFDTQSASIFVGCALATILMLGWKPRRILVAPVALWAIWYIYRVVDSIYQAGDASRGLWPLAVDVGVAAVICWLVWWPSSVPSRILAFAPIAYLGRISYGMYLWHLPIKSVAADWGYKDSATAFAIVTAITIPVASISFFLVERPFLRLKDRFRTPGAVAVARPSGPAEPEPGDDVADRASPPDRTGAS